MLGQQCGAFNLYSHNWDEVCLPVESVVDEVVAVDLAPAPPVQVGELREAVL